MREIYRYYFRQGKANAGAAHLISRTSKQKRRRRTEKKPFGGIPFFGVVSSASSLFQCGFYSAEQISQALRPESISGAVSDKG